MRNRLKTILRTVLAAAMILIGVTHFRQPEPFVAIVPAYLPEPLLLVYLSGFFEILGGVGLCLSRVRKISAWGLVALYIAVFPANLNMAINRLSLPGSDPIPDWVLWARLPLQVVLILWAYWYTRAEGKGRADGVIA